MTKLPGATEAQIQRQIISYLRLNLPGAIVAHVPNAIDIAGKDAARAVSKAKREGMLPGFPDLVCVWRGEVFFVEVKTDTGRLSQAQKQVIEAIREQATIVIVARSCDDLAVHLSAVKDRQKHGARKNPKA